MDTLWLAKAPLGHLGGIKAIDLGNSTSFSYIDCSH